MQQEPWLRVVDDGLIIQERGSLKTVLATVGTELGGRSGSQRARRLFRKRKAGS